MNRQKARKCRWIYNYFDMAKKTTAKATKAKGKHPGTGHTCGECLRGVYSQKHTSRDTHGRPFLKICEFSEYATNAAGEHVCLNSTAACSNFVE